MGKFVLQLILFATASLAHGQTFYSTTIDYYNDFSFNPVYESMVDGDCKPVMLKNNEKVLRCIETIKLIVSQTELERLKQYKEYEIPIDIDEFDLHAKGFNLKYKTLNIASLSKGLVTALSKRHTTEVNAYTFIDDHNQTFTINSTPNHKFYIANKKRFISISEIAKHAASQSYDDLVLVNGSVAHLICTSKQCFSIYKSNFPVLVYNLTINRDHQYMVGAGGVKVHNMNCGASDGEPPSELARYEESIPELPNEVLSKIVGMAFRDNPLHARQNIALVNKKFKSIVDIERSKDEGWNSLKASIEEGIDDVFIMPIFRLVGENKLNLIVDRVRTDFPKLLNIEDVIVEHNHHVAGYTETFRVISPNLLNDFAPSGWENWQPYEDFNGHYLIHLFFGGYVGREDYHVSNMEEQYVVLAALCGAKLPEGYRSSGL